ncbi:MAG: hypothetical protein ACREAY_11305 [Nitrososphaera sp.]|uniref:hypothetical protein n=1 Tax=Nitrososphaera sp. TaxID=1971748 RepID=UPI003D6EB045
MVKRIWAIILIVASMAAISFSIYFNNISSSITTTSPSVQRMTCPKILDLDPQTPQYNVTGIECVQTLLERCQPETLILGYQFGSTKLSINGEEDGRCSIRLVHEIEMGESTFNCLVPFNMLAKWESWKNSGGGDALNDILPYCKEG